MPSSHHLAIVGSGASALYLLKHLCDRTSQLQGGGVRRITVFEKSSLMGMGMPYSPETTDRYNMANIASEELPELPQTFAEWLREQDPQMLEGYGIEKDAISEAAVYSRLALGSYLRCQYQLIIKRIQGLGITVAEFPNTEVVDIHDGPTITLDTRTGECHDADLVVIATGHFWKGEDVPSSGYFASPWPIFKVLPDEGEHFNFAVGTLGASLSAFDVISSLAHRHGHFHRDGKGLHYSPFDGTDGFKMVMHAAHGWLPHLQCDQDEPFRELYRHVDRQTLLGMVDNRGFLRIDTYFDEVCRPALSDAFTKDGLEEIVLLLADRGFGLHAFVNKLTASHEYRDAFQGLRKELVEARESVEQHKPIHWKEVVDDLMYTLNFHAEMMPAEDHQVFHSVVMPFLMNVIAALPLGSAEILLALHDAGCLELVAGYVSVEESEPSDRATCVSVEHDGTTQRISYRRFIDCSGQSPLELQDYPFPSLIRQGAIRAARAEFADPGSAQVGDIDRDAKGSKIFTEGSTTYLQIGGIDIDASLRVIGKDGNSNPRIFDIAFPHTSGVRPYSYGLQACSVTGSILVDGWVKTVAEQVAAPTGVREVSKFYGEA